MADGWQTYPVELRGGLITNIAPLQQGLNFPGSARQLRNFEPSVEGGYRRVLGYEKYDDNALTGTGLVRGLIHYDNKVYAVRSNTGAGQGELYESSGNGWTRISTDAIRFGTGTGKVRFVKYNFNGTEKIMGVDGISKPIIYDGSTISQLSSLSSAYEDGRHLVLFKDHIFLAKATSILFSAPFSDTDWSVASGGGEIVFNDEITGMHVFRDNLYIFTRTQIHRIAGSTVSDFQKVPVSTDLGCVEEDTIQEIAGDVIFMGPDGLRLLSGTERIGDVGLGAVTKNIQSEMIKFQNRNNTFSSIVLRKKSQYRIFGYKDADPADESQGILGTQFASQGGEDMAWAELRGFKAYVTYSEYADTLEVIYFANNDGYVYQMESGITFDGTNIEASFFSPYLAMNDPTLRKTIYKVHTYIDPEGSFNADMTLNYDFGKDGIIQPAAIQLTNLVDAQAGSRPIAVYGEASYATYEAVATANVNGAITDSTALVLDGNSGTIEVGHYVSGTGITNTPTVAAITDQNNITLSHAQTLDDDTALSFSDNTTVVTADIYGDAAKGSIKEQVTGSGFVVSVEYTSDGSTQPFTLDAVALEFATNSRR